jgi:hypothetical protein
VQSLRPQDDRKIEFLRIPSGTLAQWRSQRRGPPYIKLEERLVRYRLSDLDAYLSGHSVHTGELGDVPIAVRMTAHSQKRAATQ